MLTKIIPVGEELGPVNGGPQMVFGWVSILLFCNFTIDFECHTFHIHRLPSILWAQIQPWRKWNTGVSYMPGTARDRIPRRTVSYPLWLAVFPATSTSWSCHLCSLNYICFAWPKNARQSISYTSLPLILVGCLCHLHRWGVSGSWKHVRKWRYYSHRHCSVHIGEGGGKWGLPFSSLCPIWGPWNSTGTSNLIIWYVKWLLFAK